MSFYFKKTKNYKKNLKNLHAENKILEKKIK